MGYAGKTIVIPCDKGGWNTNPNYDSLDPSMMEDVTNVNMHLGGRTPRGGTQKVNSTAIVDSPRVMGVFQYVKKNGDSFILTATADGKIYSNYTTLIKAGLTNNKVTTFEIFDDKVYICNGADMPQVWDGLSLSTENIGNLYTETPSSACTATIGVITRPCTAKNTCVDLGEHSYKITYVTNYGESNGSTASNTVDLTANGVVSLSDIPVGGSDVIARRIYRTLAGDDSTTYALVDEISDNTTTTYMDDTWDTDLGVLLPTGDAVPADWTDGNFPKRMIKHGKGASERLWAIGCTLNPSRIYVSENGTDNFADTVLIQLNIETGDGLGIIDAVEFGDRLICLGKTKAYIIDDQDLTVANWGYSDAQWTGGVGALRLVVETPNDIIAMAEDGDIYSVKVAESYGDYTAASLLRPAFLHIWMQENVDLSLVSDFHMVYDYELKAVRVFVVRKGQSQVDTCLVFFTERGTVDGWTKHNNLISISGFDASCSASVRVGPGEYKTYTGDYSGYVWKLEHSEQNDDGNYYYAGFTTVPMVCDTPRGTKNFHSGWVVIRPKGTETLNINLYVDNGVITENAYLVTEGGDYIVTDAGDSLLVSASTISTSQGMWQIEADENKDIQNADYRLGINGKRIQFEVFNNAKDEDFFINELMVDFRPLSARFT